MVDATQELLNEREKTHGSFETHARVTQTLKSFMAKENVYDKCNPRQCEAIDMILHKLGRIAAGNPNFEDHWDDIAGYAKLGSQACK